MFPNIKAKDDVDAARILHEGILNHMGLDTAKKFLCHDPPLMGNIPEKYRSPAWLDANYPQGGDCIPCLKAKARQMSKPQHKTEREPLTRVGQLVATDIITLDDDMESSYAGHRYIIFFYCIVSGFCMALTLANRENLSEALAWAIDNFQHFGHKIEMFQSDNEYVTKAISELQGGFDFRQRISCPIESKFQNGYAERMVQTLMNQTRCAMFSADVTFPKWAWTQALQFAINMRNLTQISLAGTETAYTAFTKIIIDFSDITTIGFGTRCEVLLKDKASGALDERTVKGFYLGPALNSKNVSHFMILDENGDPGRVSSSTIGRRSWWPVTERATGTRDPIAIVPEVTIEGPIDSLEAVRDDLLNTPTPAGNTLKSDEAVIPKITPVVISSAKPSSAREFVSAHKSRKTVEKERSLEEARQRLRERIAAMNQKEEAAALKKKNDKIAREEQAKKVLEEATKARESKANAKAAREALAKKAYVDAQAAKEAERAKAAVAAEKAKLDAKNKREAEKEAQATAKDAREAAAKKALEDARVKREADKAALEQEKAEKALVNGAIAAKNNYEAAKDKSAKRNIRNHSAPPPQQGWNRVETRKSRQASRKQVAEKEVFMANVATACAAMNDSFASLPDPKGSKAAAKAPDADLWRQAEDREMDKNFFGRNSGTEVTFEEMKGETPLHTMFNYRKKFDTTTGEYLSHKSRMLIMGNEEDVNPDENNYAPTVGIDQVRLIIKAAQAQNLILDSADIEAAFLQEYMPLGKKDIFIMLPLSYTKGKRRYFKLNKSHYGLRGAPKIFHDGLVKLLVSKGYEQCPHDPCVFKRVAEDGNYIFLAIHVDDILIAASNTTMRDQFKDDLATKYGHTYQQDTTKFIGISINRDKENGKIKIHQSLYAKHIVEVTGMVDAPHAASPANHLPFTGKSAGPGDQESLRITTGLVQFLYSGTRPDLGVALNKVATKQGNPAEEDNIAARRIVRNIAATVDEGITYSGTDMTLYSHADASFGQEKDFKSRNGYCHNLGRDDGLIAWHTSVQTMTAQSTQEAEVITLSECARQTVHLRAMLNWMGYPQEGPTTILEDNQGAIAFAEGRGSHDRNRHIGVRYYYVKEQVVRGVVRVEYVETTLQLADIFTKILLPENHRTQASKVLGAE